MKTTTYYAASAGCGAMRGLGDTAATPCMFSQWMVYPAAKRIQETLVALGAKQIKVDGIWGPCTESAYQNVFGEPLSKESLQSKLGIVCSSFSKTVSGTCKDGSDTVTPIGGSGGQPTTPPIYQTPTAMQSLLAKLSPSKAAPSTVSKVSPTLVSSVYRKPITVASATSSSEQTLIPGVPNLYVTIGGLALIGVAGWFAYGAMSGGGKKVRRNSGHRSTGQFRRGQRVASKRSVDKKHFLRLEGTVKWVRGDLVMFTTDDGEEWSLHTWDLKHVGK